MTGPPAHAPDERFRRHLLFALGAALLLRLAALAIPVDPFLNPDSLAFRDLARSLVERGRLAYVDQGAPGVELVAFRSLLYPVFLAAFLALGSGLAGALVAQGVLGLATIAGVAFLGRHAFGPKLGTIAAWVGALYWGSIQFERQITSEALFAPLLVLATWLAMRTNRPTQALLAGSAFGLAALVRPAGVFAGLIAAAFRSTRTGRGPVLAAFLVASLALVLAPALLRNRSLLGRPVLLTSGGMNFWFGNGRGVVGDAWQIMQREVGALGELGMDDWFYADTWKHRAEILKGLPGLLVHKIRIFLGLSARGFWDLPYRLLWPIIALGLVLSRPRDGMSARILLAVVASQVALAILTVPWARYRYPIEPLLWPYAAAGLEALTGRGPRGWALLAGILVVNGALLAWQMR